MNLEDKDVNFVCEIIDKPLAMNRSANFKNDLSDPELINNIKRKEVLDLEHSYIYDGTLVRDDDIPNSYKAIGGNIKRAVNYYHLSRDENGKNIVKDENGEDTDLPSTNGIFETNNDITIYTNVFVCKKEDYDHYKYLAEYEFREGTLFHELKHARNRIYSKLRLANPKSKTLSAENLYRLQVDNEISATIESNFKLIDKYFKEGLNREYLKQTDLSDELYAIFKKNNRDKDAFNKEAKKYLMNTEKIVTVIADKWNKNHKKDYDRHSFGIQMMYHSEFYPTHKISFDASVENPEFLINRKFMYTFDRYNPDTGKTDNFNVSSLVKPAKIEESFKRNIIYDFILKIKERRKKLADIDIVEAKKMNRDIWEDNKHNMMGYPSGVKALGRDGFGNFFHQKIINKLPEKMQQKYYKAKTVFNKISKMSSNAENFMGAHVSPYAYKYIQKPLHRVTNFVHMGIDRLKNSK